MRSAPIRYALGFAAAGLSLVFSLNCRLSARMHVSQRERPVDEATIPSARWIGVLSLGHREWAADLLWTSGLVYFGESIRQHSAQRYLQRYATTIEEVNPDFRQAYLWGATVSVYSGRRINVEAVQNSNSHLERGLARFPGDGEMLYQLGFNEYFEMGQFMPQGSARDASRRRGALHLRQASEAGYGPRWLVLAAATAMEDSGQDTLALELLRDALTRTNDPAVRAQLERRIESMSAQGANDPSLVEARRFETERARSMPYVPPTLYLFIGPKVER